MRTMVVPPSRRAGERIPGALPRLDAAPGGARAISLPCEFRCLTGSGCLLRSRAVEDQLAVARYRRQHLAQRQQRDRALELHAIALLLVLVAAHEQRLPRLNATARLFGRDPLDIGGIHVSHTVILLAFSALQSWSPPRNHPGEAGPSRPTRRRG